MRILVTADIHYDIARSRAAAEEAAEQALAIGGDALVIVGDIAGRNREAFCEALRLFEKFPGRKWFVPGNHCLWVWPGECSLQRYEHDLPAWAAEEGFECLDFSPAELGGVGFVALLANAAVAWMLFRYRSGDSNMRSVWLCSRNDAIANVAVIVAASGVWATGTAWPDLLVGVLIAGLALTSAFQIVRQARQELGWA